MKDWQVNTELPMALALVEMDRTSTKQEVQERKKTNTRRQGVGKVSTRGQDQGSIQGEVTRRSTRDRISTRVKGKGKAKASTSKVKVSTEVESEDLPGQE